MGGETRLNVALRRSTNTVDNPLAEAVQERQAAASTTLQTREADAARAQDTAPLGAHADEAPVGDTRNACTAADNVPVAELERVRAEMAEANHRNELLLEQMRTRAAAEQARAVHAVRVRTEAEATATFEAALSHVRAKAKQEREAAVREARSTADAEGAATRATDETEAVAAALKQAQASADERLASRERQWQADADERLAAREREWHADAARTHLTETPESTKRRDTPIATPDVAEALDVSGSATRPELDEMVSDLATFTPQGDADFQPGNLPAMAAIKAAHVPGPVTQSELDEMVSDLAMFGR